MRHLTDLAWNPRQDENFHPLSDAELARLADDMQSNGQRDAIEITPDGRIIDGHQRFRAALGNGWDEVRVRVRHDLAGDEAAIERRMIEANLNRRQLDGLDRVRLARRMREIDRKVEPGGLNQWAQQDLRDQIGESLGMSGRNVRRHLNVLNAPMEIQRSCSEGSLSLTLAGKVARLGEAVRAEVADEIAAGGDPTEVVLARLPAAAHAEVDPERAFEGFLMAAALAVEALDGRVDQVRGGADLDPAIRTLRRAGTLIDRLVDRHKSLKKERTKVLRGLGKSRE